MNSYSKPPSCSWMTKMRPKLIQDKSLCLLRSCHKPGIVLSFTCVFGSWSVFEADAINFLPSLLSLALFLPGEAWFVMASKYTAYDSFSRAPRDENCGLLSFSVLLVRPQYVSLFLGQVATNPVIAISSMAFISEPLDWNQFSSLILLRLYPIPWLYLN